MANKLYEETDIQNIANAIRGKNGTQDTYKVSQMANAITNIPSGGGDDFKKLIDNTITTADIPNGVEKVAMYKFYSCDTLTTVSFPSTLTTIESSAFNYCTGLTTINFVNGLTTLGISAFGNCTSLVNLSLPNTVTALDTTCFYRCTNLTNVTLSTSLKLIPSQCFSGCTSITQITIPASVTVINRQAFSGCTSIIKYDFTSFSSVPTLQNTNAFTNINANCKMVVPDSLYSTWRGASNWSTYASHIIKESDYNA